MKWAFAVTRSYNADRREFKTPGYLVWVVLIGRSLLFPFRLTIGTLNPEPFTLAQA